MQAAGGEKRVIVTETGWPGNGQPVAGAVPSPENAMRYFVDVQQWARREGVRLFYFSSFDEPWKLRRKADLQPQAANVDHTPLPSPHPYRARREVAPPAEERRPFRNVEVRKLGPGRRHNRPQAFSWAARLPT